MKAKRYSLSAAAAQGLKEVISGYEYKLYVIDTLSYPDFITVNYAGDDLVFNSIQEAKQFIDSITA